MALIKCYECEKEISDKAPACPHCGAPKEEQPPEHGTATVTVAHTWASIVAGFAHTIGITTSGDAYAWGENSSGELGDGTTTGDGTSTRRLTQTLVSGGHTWASISAGSRHTLGLTTSGEAYAWGCNSHGQLGDGTTTDRWTPVKVLT